MSIDRSALSAIVVKDLPNANIMEYNHQKIENLLEETRVRLISVNLADHKEMIEEDHIVL